MVSVGAGSVTVSAAIAKGARDAISVEVFILKTLTAGGYLRNGRR